MQKDTKNWTYAEFLGFVLVWAANADDHVEEAEIKLIEQKVGHTIFVEANAVFEHFNDVQCAEIILSYKDKYYHDEASKQQFFGEMMEVFCADDEIDSAERMSLMMLKHLIGH